MKTIYKNRDESLFKEKRFIHKYMHELGINGVGTVIDSAGNFRPNSIWGNTYFVDYRNGSDSNSGKTPNNARKTLSSVYGLLTSNNQDMVIVDGDSAVVEDNMITWAKNRTYVYGVGGSVYSGQGFKLQQSTAGKAEDEAANLTVTGVRCTFANIKIINEGTDAASLAAVVDAGEAGVWTNCSFMKFSDLDQATVANFICKSDSAYMNKCEFGFDTLTITADRPNFWIKGEGAGARCKGLKVYDCRFVKSGTAAANDGWHVAVYDTNSLYGYNEFKDCVFANALIGSASVVAANGAISSVASLGEGNILFANCVTNADDVCDASGNGDSTNIKCANGGATSNVDGGLALTPAST